MKRKFYLILIILSFGILSAGFINNTQSENQNSLLLKDKHPKVDWTIGCTECHEEITPKVFKDWNMSKHGQVDLAALYVMEMGRKNLMLKGKITGVWAVIRQWKLILKKLKLNHVSIAITGIL